MKLLAGDACLSYQHSDPACVNSVINKELRKDDVWLGAINFLLTINKLNFFVLTISLRNVILKNFLLLGIFTYTIQDFLEN